MKKITFGRTNVKVSTISLGTWSYGSGNVSRGQSVGWADQSDADSRAALIQAWKSDINHWDTADVYGNGHSEKIIGNVWNVVPVQNILYILFPKDQMNSEDLRSVFCQHVLDHL